MLRNENNQTPFLTTDQISGIRLYGLTPEQVQTPNFGLHTLEGIRKLRNRFLAPDNQTAFTIIAGLNADQVRGMLDYGLSNNQVNTLNFGEHTIEGIRVLLFNNNLNSQQAFQRISGLNPAQATGVVNYNLNREQVSTENFGQHTLNAIDTLIADNNEMTPQAAFEVLRGLNHHQTMGVSQYRLRRNHVTDASFGEHTLTGMQELVHIHNHNGNQNFNMEDAFEALRGLNVAQTRGVIEFRLSREQVLQSPFGEPILNTMRELHEFNPLISGVELFEFAMQMPDYQIRAINEYNFTPDQLGIFLDNDEIVQLKPEEHIFASGTTVEATNYLISAEGMNWEQAFRTAERLTNMQTMAMTDFGLSLEQVQSSFFTETEGILDRILTSLIEDNNDQEEVEIPLLPEDRKRAKEIMASLWLESNLKSIKQAEKDVLSLNKEETTSKNESDISEEYCSLSSSEDINEFLRYAYSRDVLGVFDGIRKAISNERSLEKKQERPVTVADGYSSVMQTVTEVNFNAAAQTSGTETEEGRLEKLKALASPVTPRPVTKSNSKKHDDGQDNEPETQKIKSTKSNSSKKTIKNPKL